MEQRMVRVARLDHDLVYWGLVEKPLAAVQAGELVFCPPELRDQLPDGARWVDAGCDLAGGVCKWNAELGRFDPLPRTLRKKLEEQVPHERALYELLKANHQRDAAGVPSPCIEWALGFEKSLDSMLGFDEGQKFLNYFHAATGRKRQ